MELRVPELLKERGWTAYELSKRSDGHISMSAAYRLEAGDWKCLSRHVLEGLCIAFDLEDASPLFTKRKPAVKRGRPK